MGEDLIQEFILDLVELLEGSLQDDLVVAGGGVEVVAEAVGGVVHEHLGILEASGVAGEAEVDELGVVLYLLEGIAGLIGFTGEHLVAGEFGHGVDEFGVEEALLARIGLQRAGLELLDDLGICLRLVDGGGAGYGRKAESEREEEEGKQFASHNAPRRERVPTSNVRG